MKENSTWWHRSSRYYHRGIYEEEEFKAHLCSLDSKIDELVQNAMGKVKGWKLEDFPENRRNLLEK